MSFTCDTIWPMRLDLSSLECRQILREKELLCYSDVVSVLRAQGPLSDEKRTVLSNLQKILSISDDRNKAEFRRAANNEKLATIAETVSGFDAYTEWASLGAQIFPPISRPSPRTCYCDQACQTVISNILKEKDFSSPMDTRDSDITDKIESSIISNRIINKDRYQVKTEGIVKLNSSTMTMGIDENSIIKSGACSDVLKANLVSTKDSSTSHDYNLHLLSEIATGESSQSDLIAVSGDGVIESSIRPDSFSIHNQIKDIDQCYSSTISAKPISQSPRHALPSNVLMPISSGVNTKSMTLSTTTTTSSTFQHEYPINNNNNVNTQIVISNSAAYRYVLPRNAGSNISFMSTNTNTGHQKDQLTTFGSQQQQQLSQSAVGGAYITLSSSGSLSSNVATNQLRSSATAHHHLTANWVAAGGTNHCGQQHQPQAQQQVYIQNVSSGQHGGINLQYHQQQHQQPNIVHHQTGGDYSNSLAYALKQRAISTEDQQQKCHPTNQANNKLVVRNLGSQSASDYERNKRFMVVKGGSGGGSVAPTTKKPKISNPSNRQPGRPPLMPAPSTACTSRPYVANEIFHNSRAINTMSSISDTTTDSNGLKISSISSGAMGISVNSPQVRLNPYSSVNRGNGLQRSTNSANNKPGSATGSGSIIQLGGGSGPQILSVDTPRNVGIVSTNPLRPKNIQPVISVVPLSPRGLITTDNMISSDGSILGNSNKDDNSNIHNLVDKDSSTSVKVFTKNEVYANLMERINSSSTVSLSQTENKIQ